MNRLKQSPKALLIEQIGRDYEDFKESMVHLGGEELYELAPTVAAIHDVYTHIKSANHLTEGYAAHLMKRGNALYYLADKWKAQLRDFGGEDFDDMLFTLADYSGCDEEYEEELPAALVDELLEKYGKDTPLNTAAMLGLIELGREFLDFFKMNDNEESDA